MIRPYADPLQAKAGFLVLSGNLFDFAILKTSVISEDFRRRYLNRPGREGVFEARAIVFDDGEDYHARINDPALGINEDCILVMRGAGVLGWPGSAEVVNMQPPDALLQRGIEWLPTLGDGRQSGTSDSPSILHASPESAVGGGLAWLQTGDTIRVDLNAGTCDALVGEGEIARRKAALGPPAIPPSNTPWEELFREKTGQLGEGGVMDFALKYRGTGHKLPRHNH
jgi:dihydroxy-acid dehydratase